MGDDLDCVSFSEHPVERLPLTAPVCGINYLWVGVAVADTRVRVFRGLKEATSGTTLRGEVGGYRYGYRLVAWIGSRRNVGIHSACAPFYETLNFCC